MILLSDVICGLRKHEVDLLYEYLFNLARRRFPVIELLQARHGRSEAMDLFVHPALLVEEGIIMLRIADDIEDLPDEECLSAFDHDPSFHPLHTLIAQLHRPCIAVLRHRLPRRLRQLDDAGLWEEWRRITWERISTFVDDEDMVGPDFQRTLLAAMQATRFAKPSDVATWDFTYALIELQDRAIVNDGESFDRKVIAQFLNDDWTYLGDNEAKRWTPTDVTRAQERFETFLSQCRKGGAGRQAVMHTA